MVPRGDYPYNAGRAVLGWGVRVLFIGTQFSILYTSMYSPAGECVRCMQWLCCVFGMDTGLKFREVASKGPLDVLIRELCKIT
jgi:predicted membrane channel-forming protein YqfA (hemolysin III family)